MPRPWLAARSRKRRNTAREVGSEASHWATSWAGVMVAAEVKLPSHTYAVMPRACTGGLVCSAAGGT